MTITECNELNTYIDEKLAPLKAREEIGLCGAMKAAIKTLIHTNMIISGAEFDYSRSAKIADQCAELASVK